MVFLYQEKADINTKELLLESLATFGLERFFRKLCLERSIFPTKASIKRT